MEGRNFTIFRQQSLDNAVLVFCLGMVWLAAAIVGSFKLPNIAILVFLLGTTLIKPLVRTIRRGFNLSYAQSENSNLVISCITIGITLGLMVVFFPFVENINIFFPAFGLILGVIFAVAGQVTNRKTYWMLSLTVIASSIYGWFNFLEYFTTGGYLTAGILLTFSGIIRAIPEVSKVLPLESGTKQVAVGPRSMTVK